MTPNILVLLGGLSIVVAIVLVVYYERKISELKGGSPGIDAQDQVKSEIILNSIDDGVFLVGADNTIQLFNPGASRITGWPAEEAVGIDYKVVINLQNDRGEPYTDDNSPFNRAINGKVSVRDNGAYIQTKSKTIISVDIGVTPLFDEYEDFQGYISIFRDVSAKRKEEQQRADFISTASHEMRTPVAAIEGYLALALNENVSTIDNKARGFLLRAHDNSKHLGKLFQDLLASSKAEDGRLENNLAVVEIGSLITELANDFRVLTQEKGIELQLIMGNDSKSVKEGKTINVIKPLYYAHVDPHRIREAVTSLFDNALKYTESGRINIGLTGDESIIQIRVEDTGIGIAPENIPHLFQKFYRIDNSDTRTIGGTGLGLFICKKIVELYGGRIWAESELGKGSSFYINIPRISAARASELEEKQLTENTISNQENVGKAS